FERDAAYALTGRGGDVVELTSRLNGQGPSELGAAPVCRNVPVLRSDGSHRKAEYLYGKQKGSNYNSEKDDPSSACKVCASIYLLIICCGSVVSLSLPPEDRR
ncbi:unnamed protein product, partial [Fusarium langsethiae]